MAKYKLGDIFIGDFGVTQRYGANPNNYSMFALPGHEGVDWGTPNGTPIVAPFDGIVLRDTFADKDYGNFTVIWDPKQLCAVWFCHLQDILFRPGNQVSRGQILGHTNNTGHSFGPHLHTNFVETDANGTRINLGNGKQGFLDILDPNLVEWSIGGSQPVPTPPQEPEVTDDEQRALNALKAFKDSDPLLKGGNYEGAANAAIGAYHDVPTLKSQLTQCKLDLEQERANDEHLTQSITNLSKKLDDAIQVNSVQALHLDEIRKSRDGLQVVVDQLKGERPASGIGISVSAAVTFVREFFVQLFSSPSVSKPQNDQQPTNN